MTGREFFTAKTVAEALSGFRPTRRSRRRGGGLDRTRCTGSPRPTSSPPEDLPGFPRSTVDGFAVSAADTYGSSEGLPTYLDLLGAVRMGAAPDVAVRPGGVWRYRREPCCPTVLTRW